MKPGGRRSPNAADQVYHEQGKRRGDSASGWGRAREMNERNDDLPPQTRAETIGETTGKEEQGFSRRKHSERYRRS